MIKVMQSIRVYELDDEDVCMKNITIGVDSHWKWDSWVVLQIGGKSYAVNGADLKKAIDNARNTR